MSILHKVGEGKTTLEILQDARDLAKTPEEKQKAQQAIDLYFMGEPKKKSGKKKRKRKRLNYDNDDDWGYSDEWGDY